MHLKSTLNLRYDINELDLKYHQTSNMSRTLIGYEIVDHSAPVGVAPTASSFSTW